MQINTMISQLSGGMLVSTRDFCGDAGVFPAPWSSDCFWQNVEE